jgi:formylglycine-generating enzyme required for sulfatase activity/tRNA A-37 threonylcarbamoyl transferase component Bud32
MLYCLNHACNQPQNPDHYKFCQTCGTELHKAVSFQGRYRVVAMLGEGAFGRTYKAEDLNFKGKPRVIKKFIAQVQGEALTKAKELFEREAEKLDELHHPQIPRVYDYFEEGNALYLVEAFIEGETLQKEYSMEGRFSEEKVRELLEDILPILTYLHGNNLIHRDIKPDNIMRRRQDGKLILIDFGGVKEQTTTIGTGLYTPGYAAHEHAIGQPAAMSDIYSLGATCVRLLTGCFPPASNNQTDLVYDGLEQRWTWKEVLREQNRRISPQLAQVLDKMLEHKASDRYQSAEEVLQGLSQPRVTSAPPVTPVQPTVVQNPPPATVVSGKGAGQSLPVTRRKWLKWVGLGGLGVITTVGIRELFVRGYLPLSFRPENYPPIPEGRTVKPYNFNFITVNDEGKEINDEKGESEYFTEALGNGVSLEMVAIPGGTFMMGSPEDEKGRSSDESPQHKVTLSPFWMSKYQITQAQWEAIMGKENNRSNFKGENNPVERVSWDDCQEFCQKLSQKTGLTFRLPSESQWEYACRSQRFEVGSLKEEEVLREWNEKYNQPFHFGETITTDLANYDGSSTYANEPKGVYRKETTPLGTFSPNAFGLYDMHGNVWEWCQDTWHDNYEGAPTDGSAWETGNSSRRVVRGGSWNFDPWYCRSASRYGTSRDARDNNDGFRIVCLLSPRTQSP